MLYAKNDHEVDDFFEYGPIELEVERELPDVRFGEFLVERGLIDRSQLLCALQLQDRRPYLRIGTCAVALSFLTRLELARALREWSELSTLEV